MEQCALIFASEAVLADESWSAAVGVDADSDACVPVYALWAVFYWLIHGKLIINYAAEILKNMDIVGRVREII